MLSSLRKQRAVLDVERRKARESTFTEPIHCSATDDPAEFDQLKQFLTQFYRTIYHRQAEIREILDVEPQVATHYQHLVNETKQVTMEEFWQRYFYRCDVERLIQQWDRRDATVRQARADVIAESLSSVSKLAKSWSEKAIAISSNSRHGTSTTPATNNSNNPNLNRNSIHGRPKSAPVSPMITTGKATNAAANILAAALQKGGDNNNMVEDLNLPVTSPTSIVATLDDMPKAKNEDTTKEQEVVVQEEGEEESVVFDEEPNPPMATTTVTKTTTSTVIPVTNSRIMELLQDDNDNDDDEEGNFVNGNKAASSKESHTTGAAIQQPAVDLLLLSSSKPPNRETPTSPHTPTSPSRATSKVWKSLGTNTSANIPNELSSSEPMLTKLTSTKFATTTDTSAAIATTASPPRPMSTPSPPVLFREWSRSTTPPLPSQPPNPSSQDEPNALQPGLSNSVPSMDMELAGDSFHGRRRQHHHHVQEKATAQLEKLETSLFDKAIVRMPNQVVVDDGGGGDGKTAKSQTQLSSSSSSSGVGGARPLDDVMRDWNRNEAAPMPKDTTTNTDGNTDTTSNNIKNNKINEETTLKVNETTTTERTTEVTTEVVAAEDANGVTQDTATAEVVPTSQEQEEVSAKSSTPAEIGETVNPPPIETKLADDEKRAQGSSQTKRDGDGEASASSHSTDADDYDDKDINSTKTGEELMFTSETVGTESFHANPQDDEKNGSNEEKDFTKFDAAAVVMGLKTSMSNSESSSSSYSASLATCHPSSLETAEDHKQAVTHELKDSLPASYPPSLEPVVNYTNKPKRSWLVSMMVMACLVLLAVMSKVAWVWATTTPDGINFVDALCAPVKAGTTFPLENNLNGHAFEAPWWAPPTYKKLAFDTVCESTTNGRVSRKRIRLDWITPIPPPAQGHRKNGDNKKKQVQLHRFVISSLTQQDHLDAEVVLYDAWLSSAVITATDIETVDKRGVRQVVGHLWTARDNPAPSFR